MSDIDREERITEEEWARFLADPSEGNRMIMVEFAGSFHTAGAIALYGFFTWEMVDALRSALRVYEGESFNEDGDEERWDYTQLRDLADKLESLLPPRDET